MGNDIHHTNTGPQNAAQRVNGGPSSSLGVDRMGGSSALLPDGGRHLSPARQTCRVVGCDVEPEWHTVIDVGIQVGGRERLIVLPLDLCGEHLRAVYLADAEDAVTLGIRREHRPWHRHRGGKGRRDG